MLISTWFANWLLTVFLVCFTLFPITLGFLDFYIDRHEVFRLVGLQSDIYYVRNGVVNDYALKFEMNVDPHICDLNFTWRNLIKKKMPYSLMLQVADLHILGTPHMNISREGYVPTEEEVFSIGLPCAGKEDAEAHVAINVNITVINSNQSAFLTIRRKRICSKGIAHTISDDVYRMFPSTPRRQPSIQLLYIALCFVFVFVFLFAIIVYSCTRMCQ